MLTVSTSWNFNMHESARRMLREIKRLGIDSVELNFNLPSDKARDFALMQKEGLADIASVHNYCPLPEGAHPKRSSPDNPSLSSVNEGERRLAVRNTKRTLDFAHGIEAKAVVLHIGKVEVKDRTIKLGAIRKERPLYAEMKSKMMRERAQKAKAYFESALKSLEELEPYARSRGVCLGIENRYYYREIPSADEMDYILNYFGDSCVYYWHDVGHAETQDYLGLADHRQSLKRLSRRLIGVHLHDIIGLNDHKVPGDGNFDFSMLSPFLKKDTLKVIEAHQPASAEDMMRGVIFIKGYFR